MILCPEQDWRAVVAQLTAAKHIMLTTHRNPDADGIGSQIALYHVLKNMGKEVTMYNRDVVPRICRYLPQSDVIQIGETPNMTGVDTVVALDAGAFHAWDFLKHCLKTVV